MREIGNSGASTAILALLFLLTMTVTLTGIVVGSFDGWTMGAHVDPDTRFTIRGTGDLVPIEIRRCSLAVIEQLLAVE